MLAKAAFALGLLLTLHAPTVVRAELPKLSAKAYLVLHNKTGKVLLSRQAGDVMSIASLTKLQAAMVVRGKGLALKKGTTITRADHRVALGGARTRLELKWMYRNADLLHASLMASDNRATSALGRAVGLDANGLVNAMNQLARRMGLRKTNFKGPVGINHENKSTCWDVSRIVRRASKDAVLRKIMSKREYLVKPMRGYIKVYYRNTNPLVGEKKSVQFIGSKTGYNDAALYCLATVFKLPRLGEITLVLLGSKSKLHRVIDLRRVVRWLRKDGVSRLKKVP
jgi:D-alanyl-D-alanine endopeptidase (penicillin-binding protein 7)